MSLLPRLSSFHAPTRSHRDEFTPFLSLFNDTFSELQRLSDNLPASSASFAPKFDVKETADAYELQGELPGIAQKDLTIEFADENTLTVKGRTEHTREEGNRRQPTVEEEEEDKGGAKDGAKGQSESTAVAKTGSKEVAKQGQQQQHTYWVSERSVGEFARSFSFPNRVDQDNVKASLKNGILSITVPKATKQNTSRKIPVNAE